MSKKLNKLKYNLKKEINKLKKEGNNTRPVDMQGGNDIEYSLSASTFTFIPQNNYADVEVYITHNNQRERLPITVTNFDLGDYTNINQVMTLTGQMTVNNVTYCFNTMQEALNYKIEIPHFNITNGIITNMAINQDILAFDVNDEDTIEIEFKICR